jgi:hypothetical protein
MSQAGRTHFRTYSRSIIAILLMTVRRLVVLSGFDSAPISPALSSHRAA